MKLAIGEKIALLRKEKNVTQTELAEYLFLAPQSVSRWEAGSGAPEISLLPKIAAFFGVSIDELFGATSLERADELVSKYSVLRDGRSFREAMECVNSQLQTMDAARKSGAADGPELERDRDRLEALKLHLYLQQGREALRRALELAEALAARTEGKPEHPWYLPARLQRNQLLANTGKGRETLAACKKDFEEHPDPLALQIYWTLLSDLERYEEILSLQRTDPAAGELLFPPSEKNLGVWWLLVHAAAETGGTAFVERHLPSVLAVCGGQDEFQFLMCLLRVYRGERLAAAKRRLLELLPGMPYHQYIAEEVRRRIERAGEE